MTRDLQEKEAVAGTGFRPLRTLSGGLGRNFWLLWTGWTISSAGNGLTATALPLMAAYLSTDPNQVAFVSFAGKLPWLVLALIGGLLSDRWDRRLAMTFCDSFRFAVLLIAAVAVSLGWSSIWLLAAVSFLITAVDTVYDGSRQAILPMMVSRDSAVLHSANSRLMTANVAALRFLGPAAGGALFVALHPLPFYGDALSFFLGAACVFMIRGRYSAAKREGPRTPIRVELISGVVWLAKHRLLRVITIVGGLYNMITIGQLAVFVLYAKKIMHESDTAYGILLSSVAVGSVTAGFVARRIDLKLGPVSTAFFAMCVGELSYGILGVTHETAVVVVALALTGGTSMLWNVNTVSLRQSLVPGRLMGRVNGAHRLVLFGLQPFGALLGGAVAAAMGLRAPYLLGAPVALAITLTGWAVASAAARAQIGNTVSEGADS